MKTRIDIGADGPTVRFVWLLFAVASAAAIVSLLLMQLAYARYAAPRYLYWGADALLGIGFPLIGCLLIVRRKAGVLGPLFLVCGMSIAGGRLIEQAALFQWAQRGWSSDGSRMGLLQIGHLLSEVGFFSTSFIVLYFPTGRLAVRRWRLLARFGVVLLTLHTISMALQPNVAALPAAIATLPTPIPQAAWAQLLIQLTGVFGTVYALMCIIAIVDRFRLAGHNVRQQMEWPLLALLLAPPGLWLNDIFPDYAWLIGSINIGLLLLAVGIAVLRHNLWDIDFLLNRTLVYAVLSALLIALYLVLVGYLGTLFYDQGDLPGTVLATAVVAILFHPLRRSIQRAVNRLFYGERDDPYQVISRLGQQLESTLAPATVLPTIVRTVRDSLKLPYVAILLPNNGADEVAAFAGSPAGEAEAMPLTYQGERVGTLLLTPRSGERGLSRQDRRLLADLARQAGIALQAMRLTTDLQRLNDELHQSRERIITAREEERRRLRRDLHDGIGPTLASIVQRLDVARDLLEHDPDAVDLMLGDIKKRVRTSVREMRGLVYALRPPVLDEFGLLAAVRDHLLIHPPAGVGVCFDAPSTLPPLPAAVEVAAYRIVQEALQNVARHADARTCTVGLSIGEEGRVLQLYVRDDGRGVAASAIRGVGLQSMRERAEELGGTFSLRSTAAAGTTVSAVLPLLGEV